MWAILALLSIFVPQIACEECICENASSTTEPSPIQIESNKILYVGALYPIFSASRYLDTPQGALIALEEVNRNPDILHNYTLEMVKDVEVFNTACKDTKSMQSLLNQTLLNKLYSPMVGVLGAACSSASKSSASVSSMLKLPQISHSSTSPELSNSNYNYFNRVIVSDAYGGASLAALVKSLQHKRMGILFNTEIYSRSLFEEFTDRLRLDGYDRDMDYVAIPYKDVTQEEDDMIDENQDENGELIPRDQWDLTFATVMEDRHRMFAKIFEDFVALNLKTFVIFAQGQSDRNFIIECAHEFDLTGPEYTFILDGDSVGRLLTRGRFFPSPVEVPANVISFDPKVDTTVDEDFEKKFKNFEGFRFTPVRTGESEDPMNKWTPYAYDSAMTLALALDAVDKAGGDVLDGEAVLAEIRKVDFVGATGRVFLDDNGDRKTDLVFYRHNSSSSSWLPTDLEYSSSLDLIGSQKDYRIGDLFEGGMVPKDAFPPSTPVIVTDLSEDEKTLSVSWGEMETFSVEIETLVLQVAVDGDDSTAIAIAASELSHALDVSEMMESVCLSLTVVTRGGNSTSIESCQVISDNISRDTIPVWVLPVGAAFVAITFLVVIHLRRTVRLQQTKVSRLEENLKFIQEYTAQEKQLIEQQIEDFKKEYEMGCKNSSASNSESDLSKLLVNASELHSEKVIGKGSFGEVFLGTYRGQKVAVKTLINVDDDALMHFREEILLMADLRHANIVVLIGACWEEKLMALVMEYCELGMSSTVLKSEGKNFSWDDPLLKWCMDISRAISYLHSVTYFDVKKNKEVKGIIHRDLKPDNCLVTGTFSIKVADFGEARAIDMDNTMTQVGTPMYIAPEIVRGDHYTFACDVFSYGMTLIYLGLKGRVSLAMWLNEKMQENKARMSNIVSIGRVTHNIIAKDWRPAEKHLKRLEIPPSIIGLIQICLSDVDERPSFKEIDEFLKTNAMADIQGTTGGGIRRTSTSGALAMKILIAAKKQEEMNEHAETMEELRAKLADQTKRMAEIEAKLEINAK